MVDVKSKAKAFMESANFDTMVRHFRPDRHEQRHLLVVLVRLPRVHLVDVSRSGVT